MKANNPDAALIEACNQYVEAEIKHRALFVIEDDKEREAAQEVYLDIQAGLLDTIRDHKATTLEGVRARARAANAWADGADEGEYRGEAGEIMSYMVRDLLGAEQRATEPVFIPREAAHGSVTT